MNIALKFSIILLVLLTATFCSKNDTSELQGYIEGEYTYISSGESGTLFTLNVHRGQRIQKDTLLFTLDPNPDKAAMEGFAATVSQLLVETNFAALELKRYQALLQKLAIDQNSVDEKRKDFESLSKQLQNAKKNLAQSSWSYQQKTVYAPIQGLVQDTFYQVGEKVIANQPVLAMLAPADIKVLFYIPETQLSTIHVGQSIQFTCDRCSHPTKAIISYISSDAEYTPPIIYSENTRNKLVYLVRANIEEGKATQFNPGQPVDIYLHA